MTPSQRAATLAMCAAILRCSCCPPDLAERARALQVRVAFAGALGSIFG